MRNAQFWAIRMEIHMLAGSKSDERARRNCYMILKDKNDVLGNNLLRYR